MKQQACLNKCNLARIKGASDVLKVLKIAPTFQMQFENFKISQEYLTKLQVAFPNHKS